MPPGGLMATLGATLTRIEPGAVDIRLTASPDISQQHGFIHGDAIGAVADSAAGMRRSRSRSRVSRF